MGYHSVPGVQIATIRDGLVDDASCHGELDQPTHAPVTDRSLFQAASISKPVTAFAVLRLVAAGTLDLDARANQYLRSWRLPENEHTQRRPVSLRTLLSHTAGTTVHGFPGYAGDAPLPTVQQILDGETPANTSPVRVDIPVGSQFRYSGGGTMIVQQLLTDVTDRPFPALMRELVLDPLAMDDSTFDQPLPAQLRSRAAKAHDDDGAVPGGWHVYPEMAAAGLWTTAGDLARFVLGIQHALLGRPHALIPVALARDMVSPQNGVPVGLGPQLQGMDGEPRFIHSGGNRGFNCKLVGFVDRPDGVVVMTNGPYKGSPLLNEIIGAIGVARGWRDFATSEVAIVEHDAEHLDRFVGDYELRGILVKIRREGTGLSLAAPFSLQVEMHPVAEGEFVLADTTRVTFDFDGERVIGATLKQWGDTYHARRTEPGD